MGPFYVIEINSLSAFLEKVGIPKGVGPRTRLREQMNRLFTAHFQLRYDDKHGKSFISSQIADRGEFWWSERKPTSERCGRARSC